MKKILVPGLLAIFAIAAVHQEASAWINSRFGVGLHWDWQSGSNKVFWGAWKNGNLPCPEGFQGGPYGPAFYPQPYGVGAAPYAFAPNAYPAHGFGGMAFDAYAFMPAYGSGYHVPGFESYTQPVMPYSPQYANDPRMPYQYYGR